MFNDQLEWLDICLLQTTSFQRSVLTFRYRLISSCQDPQMLKSVFCYFLWDKFSKTPEIAFFFTKIQAFKEVG